MDILLPPLVWVGNRCYRKSFVEAASSRNVYEEESVTSSSQICDVYADETCDIGVNIESKSSGYLVSLKCPSVCFGLIIGKKGENKKRIENETQTQIRIPRQGQNGDIEIFGKDRAGVISAHTRITVLIETVRHRQSFTHFISFPMVSPSIQKQFDEFKEGVLQNCLEERGVDATIFQNRNKLHVTVGTLTLLDDTEIVKASKLLEEICKELNSATLHECPLEVDVQGLEYMNDDPNSVDILYAKLCLKDESKRLQSFADTLVHRFTSAGLMEKQYDKVKLHITVMNTLFRRGTNSSQMLTTTNNNTQKERECFDARKILKLYGDYNFGSLHIGSIHLSQRLSTASDGYYAAVCSVELP